MTYVHSEPQVTIIWNNCLFSEAVAEENSWVANDYGHDHFFVLGNKSTMVDQAGPARSIACNVNLTQILMVQVSGLHQVIFSLCTVQCIYTRDLTHTV